MNFVDNYSDPSSLLYQGRWAYSHSQPFSRTRIRTIGVSRAMRQKCAGNSASHRRMHPQILAIAEGSREYVNDIDCESDADE